MGQEMRYRLGSSDGERAAVVFLDYAARVASLLVLAGLIAALLFLAACTTTKGTFCAISKPLRPSEATIAAMSDAEVADMLRHNEAGRALCSWRP